ncbi:DUF371 domain-containing protein [Candidatus Woesearchaeota archaeon]|nr:DUF371 domain-containing protein [Candidatus Woesearchaeota archaeon]
MNYKFHAYGHPNILATHKTTLEFTKDGEVSIKGDCIIGVKADFELGNLKNFIKNTKNGKISMTIVANNDEEMHETILATINPEFDDGKELVIRKTNFVSERTFAISSNKAAFELNKKLIAFLKEKKNKIKVVVENKEK